MSVSLVLEPQLKGNKVFNFFRPCLSPVSACKKLQGKSWWHWHITCNWEQGSLPCRLRCRCRFTSSFQRLVVGYPGYHSTRAARWNQVYQFLTSSQQKCCHESSDSHWETPILRARLYLQSGNVDSSPPAPDRWALVYGDLCSATSGLCVGVKTGQSSRFFIARCACQTVDWTLSVSTWAPSFISLHYNKTSVNIQEGPHPLDC